MASAEELMREAQYAFLNISFGDAPDNRKNTARAMSFATKVLKKYPTTPEADVARSILWRLGDEAYAAKIKNRHAHATSDKKPHTHSQLEPPVVRSTEQPRFAQGQGERLDWQRLIAGVFKLPRAVLIMLVFAGTILFSLFGFFLIVPVVVLVAFATPLRAIFPAKNRQTVDDAIRRLNAWLKENG